jgi:hypothetical protein
VGPQDSPKRLNRKPIARQNQMLCGQIGHRFFASCQISSLVLLEELLISSAPHVRFAHTLSRILAIGRTTATGNTLVIPSLVKIHRHHRHHREPVQPFPKLN